ncbi:MAG: energy-coupling factor transporter transmembrane protein EcfT [Methanomicrobiales archaeon]|nr:energy-coupling factor transporter transmembrane protein EcfT [Methanomicrobiales archaeon]MDD1659892.1 energy-coupling factor transporter transmembrane protein EcfT [Methanomicrobiales archaeon]
MTRGWTGSHLPDPDLITWYGENGRSFLSLLSPWTRVTLLIGVVVLVTVIPSSLLLAVLYLVILLFTRAAGLPARQILSWSVIPALAVLSLVLLLIWGEPGTPLLAVPLGGMTLRLTDRGLLLAITLLLRALISFTASLLFLATTRSTHLAAVVSRIFPYPADQILLLAYRFLFVTLSMVRSLLKSLWSRGGSLLSSAGRQSRVFADAGALVFLRSYDRAERIGKAMESRGYNGMYRVRTELPPPGMRDALVLLGAGGFGVLLLAATITGAVP